MRIRVDVDLSRLPFAGGATPTLKNPALKNPAFPQIGAEKLGVKSCVVRGPGTMLAAVDNRYLLSRSENQFTLIRWFSHNTSRMQIRPIDSDTITDRLPSLLNSE